MAELHIFAYVFIALIYAARAIERRDHRMARRLIVGIPIAIPLLSVNVFDLGLAIAHGGLAFS